MFCAVKQSFQVMGYKADLHNKEAWRQEAQEQCQSPINRDTSPCPNPCQGCPRRALVLGTVHHQSNLLIKSHFYLLLVEGLSIGKHICVWGVRVQQLEWDQGSHDNWSEWGCSSISRSLKADQPARNWNVSQELGVHVWFSLRARFSESFTCAWRSWLPEGPAWSSVPAGNICSASLLFGQGGCSSLAMSPL